MKSIKLFTSHKKESNIIQNPLFISIQEGRSLNLKIEDMLGDDIADNISYKYSKYSFLTTLYWIWKNDHSDYIGFFHSNFYLNFNEILKANSYPTLDSNFLEKIGINKKLRSVIEAYDLILPIPIKNITNNYIRSHSIFKDNYELDFTIDNIYDFLKEKYPFLDKYIEDHNKDYYLYSSKSVIFTKEILNNYCEYLFPLLFELEKKINYSLLNIKERYILSYISEHFFDIYIRYLKDNPKLKWKELQAIQIKYPNIKPLPEPAFTENNIAITFSTDKKFIPIASTLLQSIIKSSNSHNNYDIILIHEDIPEYLLKILLSQIDSKTNFSLRFLNASPYFEDSNIQTTSYFNKITSYRLKVPTFFSNYSKIIFLDTDMIALKDVALLFNQDLSDFYLGAVKDFNMIHFKKKNLPTFSDNRIKNSQELSLNNYLNQYLGLVNPNNYFNAGCLLWNLDKINKENLENDFFNLMNSDKLFTFLDQDILNIIFNEKEVLYLDISWNFPSSYLDSPNQFPTGSYQGNLLTVLYGEDIIMSESTPAIIHYVGQNYHKPWKASNISKEASFYFWNIARKSPFFHELLINLQKENLQDKLVIPPLKLDRRDIFSILFPQNSLLGKILRKFYRLIRK